MQIREIILLNHQNNYIERSNAKILPLLLEHQNFLQHWSSLLRFQQNYFDGPTNFNLYIVFQFVILKYVHRLSLQSDHLSHSYLLFGDIVLRVIF